MGPHSRRPLRTYAHAGSCDPPKGVAGAELDAARVARHACAAHIERRMHTAAAAAPKDGEDELLDILHTLDGAEGCSGDDAEWDAVLSRIVSNDERLRM